PPLGGGAASAASRRHQADLAGTNAKPPGMESATERQANLGIAVPAQVDDCALQGEQLQRMLEPGGGRAGVHDEVTAVGGIGGQCEVDAERGCDVGPRSVDVDEGDLDTGKPGEEARDAAADHTGA